MTALTATRPKMDVRRYAATLLLAPMLTGGSSVFAPVMDTGVALLAAAIMCWCCADGSLRAMSMTAQCCAAILFIALALTFVQLAPLPADVWQALPGRASIAADLWLLGDSPSSATVSVNPAATIHSLVRLFPVVAVFVIASKTDRHALRFAAWVLCLAGGCLGVASVLDAANLQYGGADSFLAGVRLSWFANPNHQGDFLLMAFPVCLALGLRRTDEGDPLSAGQALAWSSALLCLAGTVVSGSIAVLAITLPVLALSALIVFPRGRLRWFGLAALAFVPGVAIFLAWRRPDVLAALASSIGEGPLGRSVIWERTLEAVGAYWPVGSGAGTFELVYPAFEDAAEVTNVFVNHAHNDYLEVALEAGLAGLMLAFAGIALIVWQGRSALVRMGKPGGRLRAASAVALLVPIAHSILDYPMRTPAIAGFAALCAAILMLGSWRCTSRGA